jgi:glycerate kinase
MPMKIVVASDSFKGCLTSQEVADAVERGIRRLSPASEIVKVLVADGGEGTVTALVASCGGITINACTHDPLMREINAAYGILPGDTAVIEVAAASGLPLLTEEERNPLIASSFGTGELIIDALQRGCRRFIIGLGGSATNDGGAGLLRALGVKFLDADGVSLPEGGAALARLKKIDMTGVDKRLLACEFLVASDVTNPLCGEQGASHVYGPQKGATPQMVEQLDAALEHYVSIADKMFDKNIANQSSAGAAGGLGAALMGFMNAKIRSGVELIIEETNLKNKLTATDWLITGEGKMDGQSKFGKAAYGIMRTGRAAGVPVIAIVGVLKMSRQELLQDGFTEVYSLRELVSSQEESMARAAELVELTAERILSSNRINNPVSSRDFN